jgi:hypothetical protein
MASSFGDLRAQLDAAAPAGLPVVATPLGGVSGIEGLSLAEQGASPGRLDPRSAKMFSPVVLTLKDSVCLSIIGQGATFCLRNSCLIGSHKEGPRRFKLSDPIIVVKKIVFWLGILGIS